MNLALEEALKGLTKTARTDIRRTLEGDAPVLARTWTAMIDEKWCGCLLMNGHAQHYHAKHGKRSNYVLYLAQLYRMVKRGDVGRNQLKHVVNVYDDWAFGKGSSFFEDVKSATGIVHVLTADGREIILAMLDRIEGKVTA